MARLTQKQLAELFNIEIHTINLYLNKKNLIKIQLLEKFE